MYTKKYAHMERRVMEKACEAKKAENIYIPNEPKVVFVMRIRRMDTPAWMFPSPETTFEPIEETINLMRKKVVTPRDMYRLCNEACRRISTCGDELSRST
ncbi:hypothetical protein pipiens_008287 [Culex pipiens pipiens]|uniref:Uncharacterized protein n=1 Tax=Culex pipiens pipiens TaxID=38569 RepID=A0ABD1DHY6_CULPP